MKKLKKLLSFVLALTMVLSSGMVAVGAANYTDEENIECLEAVQTLSELNIIVGKEDGRFDPDGTVTRAEMAKMLYVLANGGVDDGAKGYPASGFTDIKGTWGENYINAAYALGLTAGVGNNKFGPSQTVTAAQVYKMLLNLVGYEDTRSGMTGSEWAQTALRLAVKTGLTENINGIDQSEGMPRQYAAQAIYNVIDTYRVKVDDTGEYVEYAHTDAQPTVGEKYLRLQTIEGVYVGNDEVSLKGTPESDGYIRIVEVKNGEETGDTFKIEYDGGVDLLGQIVKVMFKTERTNSSNYIGYGMYATGDSEVEPFSILDDYDEDDLLNDDSVDATLFVNYKGVKNTNGKQATIGDWDNGKLDIDLPASAYLRLIYNDDLEDEDGDTSEYNALAFVVVPALNEVTTYSGDTLTFADPVVTDIKNGTTLETKKSFDLDDNDIEFMIDDDVDEDDKVIVLYNPQSDVLQVQKAESVSGEVTGKRGSNELRIDGEWYSYDGANMAAWSSYVDDDDFTAPADVDTGDEYTLYLLNGFYLAAEEGTGSGSSNDDYAIITGAYDVGEELRVKLLTADGLEKTYTIGEFCDEDVDDIKDIEGLADALAKAVDEGPVVVEYSASGSDADIDAINVKVEGFGGDTLGDDSFKLTAGSGLLFKESTGRVIGKNFDAYLDTDAAIFFDEGEGDDWDAYEFDALDDDIEWDELDNDAIVYVVMDDDEVICLAVYMAGDATPSSSTTGIHFGYLTGKPVDNGDYIEYPFWNGDETVEYEQDATKAEAARSAIFAYTLDDDMIDDIYVLMDENSMASKEFKDYTVVYGIISDVSGSRIKTAVIDGFTVTSRSSTEALEQGAVVSAQTISDSILWSIDSDDRAGEGEAKLRKNNQVIMLVNDDDEIEFAVVDTNGYFKKGSEFFSANDLSAFYADFYKMTDASEIVAEKAHAHELTYREAATAGRVVIECEGCDAQSKVDFTVDGESVSASIFTNGLELDLDVAEIAGDATVSDGSVTWQGVTVTPAA